MRESLDESPRSSPLVSIVIVNYNGAGMLPACLGSVFAQSYRPIDVIVVDNASKDESVEVVRKDFPEVRLVCSECNLGFAEGNNVGVRESRGEYIVLLNNDATVDHQWLQPLLDHMNKPNVAVVTSKVITDGIPAEFYEMNGSVNYLGYNIMRQFNDLTRVFYAGGTSLMFNRHIVGLPFINEYFLYHEDTYLSWRMRLQGYDVRMCLDSIVFHKGNVTANQQRSGFIAFYQVRNRVLNLLLFYELRTILRLIPFLFCDGLATIAGAVISQRKPFRGTLRAYWWLAAHVPWILKKRREEQSSRKIEDELILALMSADVVDEARSPKVFHFLNRISRMYARLVGLSYHRAAAKR